MLAADFGRQPHPSDVSWSLLARAQMNYALLGFFRFERDTHFYRAEQLLRERDLRESLRAYLFVSYLDLNGPKNLSMASAGEPVASHDPRNGYLVHEVLLRIHDLTVRLCLSPSDVRAMFDEQTTMVSNYPLAPNEAWDSIGAAIAQY